MERLIIKQVDDSGELHKEEPNVVTYTGTGQSLLVICTKTGKDITVQTLQDELTSLSLSLTSSTCSEERRSILSQVRKIIDNLSSVNDYYFTTEWHITDEES